jgi:hypothetical protein
MAFGDSFLRVPALFPARLAGTPAGARSLAVDVPGGPYRFHGLDSARLGALRERYGERCLGAPVPAAVDVSMFTTPASEFLPIVRAGRPNHYDFDYAKHAVRIVGHQVMARIVWRPALQAAIWTPLDRGPGFFELVENCFRSIVAYRLLELGGAALHSSAIVDGDRAWVFYGPSGAGKTTVARRGAATGRAVLSDDLNAILVDGDGAWVAKLPFAGELGHDNRPAGPYPLAGLSRLEQAEEESWHSQSPAAAVASMAACAPFLNGDPFRTPRLLANLAALARGNATGVLRFTLEGDVWPVLEAVPA